MNLRILSPQDEPAMLALLDAEKKSTDTDYYIDRGKSFWGVYNWYSKGQNLALGVFEGGVLVAQAALVLLPFEFRNSPRPTYLLTDFLVHLRFRKSFAAAKLVTGLHRNLPSKDIIYVAIENRDGFATASMKIADKYHHESLWLPRSNLVSIYPNHKISQVNPSVEFQISSEWDRIEKHLTQYSTQNDSWMNWKDSINIKNTFRSVRLFDFKSKDSSISGVLVDRGNLQALRWNGQSRLLIEKYRRGLNQSGPQFEIHSEMPFLTIAFIVVKKGPRNFSEDLVSCFYNLAFSENVFGINFRDIEAQIPAEIDQHQFSRRILCAIDSNKGALAKIAAENVENSNVMESLYL